jgi:hypothetical protein
VLLACRTIRYTARADTAGVKSNIATLVFVDSVETNQDGEVGITVLTTCGNPFGNGTRRNCPANTAYSGNDSVIIPAATVEAFEATCCVSDEQSSADATEFEGFGCLGSVHCLQLQHTFNHAQQHHALVQAAQPFARS